jgi:hypothetical protein
MPNKEAGGDQHDTPMMRCDQLWLRRWACCWPWLGVALLLGVCAFFIVGQLALALSLSYFYEYSAVGVAESIFGQSLYEKEEGKRNADQV